MAYVKNGRSTQGSSHPNLGSNQSADGVILNIKIGESVNFSNILYQRLDGKYYKARADDAVTMPVKVMACWDSTNSNVVIPALKQGFIRNDNWNFTPSSKLYAGTTAGAITSAIPTDYRQEIGEAEENNIIYFGPESSYHYGGDDRQKIKDLEKDVNALFERQTYTLQYLVVAPGEYIISEVGRHGRIKITNAYAKLADNTDLDQVVQVFIGDKAISEPLILKSTESAGKAQLIDIGLMDDLITSRDDIRVKVETYRQTEIVLLVQSYEGE